MTELKAPFPYIGGKSMVASLVWQRLGPDVRNYIEPFLGSAAVLLARPGWTPDAGYIETVTDADGLLSNFWRALQHDPDAVAEHADWPAFENDLHARHAWLVSHRKDLTSGLEGNPEWYDARAAGWWVWGASCWIAGGWCAGNGPWQQVDGRLVKADGEGVRRQLLHLMGAGQGVNRKRLDLQSYFTALAARLRRVRVCSGDWSRICGPTPTVIQGTTAVFLDPPYSDQATRADGCYAVDCQQVAHDVRQWCLEVGDDLRFRIALCGYEGEHEELEAHGWEAVGWKPQGGYGRLGEGQGRINAHRERIWFSPHCLRPTQGSLFGTDE